MTKLRTSSWSKAVLRALLLAGSAVVLVVLLPATAFGSKAKRNRSLCPDGPIVIKGFKKGQAHVGDTVRIFGKHVGDGEVLFEDGEGSWIEAATEFSFDDNTIYAVVPDGARTGHIKVGSTSCPTSDISKKRIVIL